jgi:hypothetical protein
MCKKSPNLVTLIGSDHGGKKFCEKDVDSD